MKYFLDTEFHEDGKTIDLISIALIAEDCREYYAVSSEADYDRIWSDDSCEWLCENVMCYLDFRYGPERVHGAKDRATIRQEILDFIGDDKAPEFWAYFADYDWIAFCQLFGRMIDLPKHFPMFCRDIRQLIDVYGKPGVAQENEHHALYDARHDMEMFNAIQERQKILIAQDPESLVNKLVRALQC